MKKISFRIKLLTRYFLFLIISIFLLDCKSDENELIIEKPKINIVFSKTPLEGFIKGRSLSKELKTLLEGIENENSDCPNSFVLEPTLTRGDLNNVKILITTNIEGNGFVKTTPERAFKLVKQNLDKIEVTKEFTEKSNSKSDSIFLTYVDSEDVATDSVIVFSKLIKDDSLKINGKAYKLYSDIKEVRTRILTILCQNPKATLALLIDPPSSPVPPKFMITSIEQDCKKGQLIVKTSGGNGSPILYSAPGLSVGKSSNVFSMTKDQFSGKTYTFVAKQGSTVSSKIYMTNCPSKPLGEPDVHHGQGRQGSHHNTDITGNLTIIKGSEGCEICTRYYRAKDAIGREHEIREPNSTNCCPCNKTIQVRGRTYLMNCDGSPHLELVD